MHIKHWKKIGVVLCVGSHLYLGFVKPETLTQARLSNLLSDIFTSSTTLIGFIFAVIAILISIADYPLMKKMRENKMYDELMDHLIFLIKCFSLSALASYILLLLYIKIPVYLFLCVSASFTYGLFMLFTDMLKRLRLIFTNL